MIEVRNLTKRYGRLVAVDNLTFTVQPGVVTGFLGPNGAGKSSTMRVLLGLDHPSSGYATVHGKCYRDLQRPLHAVGAMVDANATHPKRTALNHLRWQALGNRIGSERVRETLALVGLTDAATRRVGGFSLGMRQRLGIAGALLGNPGVLLFDEPVNGLDPQGVVWIRELLRSLATEGRTVLVSSHLMSEMEMTADRLLILHHGRLLADTSVAELTGHGNRNRSLEQAYLELIGSRSGRQVIWS